MRFWKSFLPAFLLGGIFFTAAEGQTEEKTVPEDVNSRPNIIFILADDLGIGELGCFGQKKIETPHLDRMSEEGMRFTCAYSGASVCAPSRATLMTGLSTGHCPVRANRELAEGGQMPLPEETFTVAQLLKNKGYATACFGKWGMGRMNSSGSPLRKGFDRFFGYNCQRHAHDYYPDFLYDNKEILSLDGKTYSADLIADRMLQWLEENGKDRPFFLFYATTLPHGKYEIDALGPYAEKNGWTPQEKTYAAMVSRLDAHVGRIRAWLCENGLEKNTLILFSGDNGGAFPPNSETARFFDEYLNYRGFKRTVYEGGLRNAALACWPGMIPEAQVCDIPWYFPDFLPTCAALTHSQLPENYVSDGTSILPLLLNNEPAARVKPMYWELHEGPFIQAVRFGNWKALRSGPRAKTELYDIQKDPGETQNVAEKYPEITAEGEKLLKELRTESSEWPVR